MNRVYSIVGDILEIRNAPDELIDYFDGFDITEKKPSPDVILTVKNVDDLPEPVIRPTMQSVFGIQYAVTSKKENFWRHILTVSEEGREYMLANDDWSELLLAMDPSYQRTVFETQPRWVGLIMCGFYFHLSFTGSLLLHASAVEYKDRAIIFTAPSGTGKTTQAELWQKYAGARILNGDKVFLRILNGRIMAWGSPWSGSSPYRVNDSAEVAAIITLSQAPINRLLRPEMLSALGEFATNVFLPLWEETALVNGMEVLDKIVSHVPIYHLNAKRDEEAVRIVQREVFGLNE